MGANLSPAAVVIKAFGGVNATAKALGRDPSSISRWQRSKDEKGSGGVVPSQLQRQVLQLAKERGLTLTAEELILGKQE